MRSTILFIVRAILTRLLAWYRSQYEAAPRIFCLPRDHVGDQIFLDGIYERLQLEFIFDTMFRAERSKFARSICIDVGANLGNHTVYFSQRFRLVKAIEPNPIFCSLIRASLAINGIRNVALVEKGFGDSRSWQEYECSVGSNLGGSHFRNSPHAEVQSSLLMNLEIVPGDDVFEASDEGHIALIKIDVEGFESRVISGLSRTILTHEPVILFESHPENDRDEAEKVFFLLKRYGYKSFYACETERNRFRDPVRKLMFRLFRGARIRAKKIDKLESREYLTIIASTLPELPVTD